MTCEQLITTLLCRVQLLDGDTETHKIAATTNWSSHTPEFLSRSSSTTNSMDVSYLCTRRVPRGGRLSTEPYSWEEIRGIVNWICNMWQGILAARLLFRCHPYWWGNGKSLPFPSHPQQLLPPTLSRSPLFYIVVGTEENRCSETTNSLKSRWFIIIPIIV